MKKENIHQDIKDLASAASEDRDLISSFTEFNSSCKHKFVSVKQKNFFTNKIIIYCRRCGQIIYPQETIYNYHQYNAIQQRQKDKVKRGK